MTIADEMRALAERLEAECERLAAERGRKRMTWPEPPFALGWPTAPFIGYNGRNGEECDALEKHIARLTVERDRLRKP